MSNVLELTGVAKSYRQGDARLDVLTGVDLVVEAGQAVALMAPSGAGKTTLLQIAGLLDKPDAGTVRLEVSRLRATSLGFVFQFHHLLPEFTALENVVLPQRVAGASRSDARRRAMELLETMGLTARADHRPSALSGGEQQRVAIARALANRPKLLLADEPTGNLDVETASKVIDGLLELAHQTGVGMLVATHNPNIAARMDGRVTLSGGRLVEA